MNKDSVVNESRVAEQLEGLREEVEKATGSKSGRARFYGFQLITGLKACIAEALFFFKEGHWKNADLRIQEARQWLTQNQRAFARNSVLDEGTRTCFFTKLILDLPHLDADIESGIEKKREAFREHVRKLDFDLDEASALSWALRDAILRAESEQMARIRNREHKREAKFQRQNKATEDLRIEQAREAQLRHEKEQATRRAELADKFAQEFHIL